jgi:transcription factor E
MQSEKRTIKLLKQIVREFGGESSEKLVDILFGKKNVNEFIIAKKLGLTINQTRNVLYRLGEEGLVKFIRKKDSKKGGWYTYFWTINVLHSLERYSAKIKEEIERLESQLGVRKNETFFICKNCHLEFNNENALLNNYTCPECGEVLEVKDNIEDISQIKAEIKKQESLLSQITEEINEIESKDQKLKARRLKAELALKAKERKKRAAERKREREKALKGRKKKAKKIKKKAKKKQKKVSKKKKQ